MDKKIVLQDGVTFSYDNDGVVRDMNILDGVEKVAGVCPLFFCSQFRILYV